MALFVDHEVKSWQAWRYRWGLGYSIYWGRWQGIYEGSSNLCLLASNTVPCAVGTVMTGRPQGTDVCMRLSML